MAFSDPQSVTINAVAQSLPRTGMDVNKGTFRKDDGTYELVIGQNLSGRRTRQSIRLNGRKTVPDALNPALNQAVTMSVTLTVDTPSQSAGGGYSLAEIKQVVDGLTAYLTAGSGSKVTQLLGGEL